MNSLLSTNRQTHNDGLELALKVTSLQYLKEALSRERYADCAEILNVAREFGVDEDAVRKLVDAHVAYLKKRDRISTFNARKPFPA